MGKTQAARVAHAQHKVEIAKARALAGCRYRCPSCGQNFMSWTLCLEHVQRRQHATAPRGYAGLQKICTPAYDEEEDAGYHSEPDSTRMEEATKATEQEEVGESPPPTDAHLQISWCIDAVPDALPLESADATQPAGDKGGTELSCELASENECRAAKKRRASQLQRDVQRRVEREHHDEELAQPWWELPGAAIDRDEGSSADDDDTMLASMRRAISQETGRVVPEGPRRRRRKVTSEDAAVCRSGPPPPLDEANRGYAMLQSLGWAPGDGLGAAGDGELLPLASTLPMQKSRKGLGRW